MEGKAKWELVVPAQVANPSVGSVIAPKKQSHQRNLYLETKLRIRFPIVCLLVARVHECLALSPGALFLYSRPALTERKPYIFYFCLVLNTVTLTEGNEVM